MFGKPEAFDDYKDHWQEKEIVLERPSTGNVTSLGFEIGEWNDLSVGQNLTSIFVVRIIKDSLTDRDKRLRPYDIILRVNDVDYSNMKHQTAVHLLKTSGKKVRLIIRRLTPQFTKVIELEHQSGKLGISIVGGIGSEHCQGDPGVFIKNIFNQINRQLSIGDRLLEVSSARHTYDLRFVTHSEAKQRIGFACSDSEKVKLTVAGHTRKLIKSMRKLKVRFSEQYDPHRNMKDEALLLFQEGATEQTLIQSFDFDDCQRYENRSKLYLVSDGTKSPILPHIPASTDFENRLELARQTNVLQYDRKKLKEIPAEIYSLPGLRTLSLNDNKIQWLSDDLRNFVNLKNLYLRNNRIEFFSSTVFTYHLSKLENLQLNGNHLHSLPRSFSSLIALKLLNLSNNRFLTVPIAILTLTNLQLLDLSGNRIRQIKDEIYLLAVDEFNLNHNQISLISPNISKCQRLKILRLNNNNLHLKSIPTSLLKHSTLLQLNVNGNYFEDKQFRLVEGYDDYERRYTANQRKKD